MLCLKIDNRYELVFIAISVKNEIALFESYTLVRHNLREFKMEKTNPGYIKRHGFLTFWIWLIIILGILGALGSLQGALGIDMGMFNKISATLPVLIPTNAGFYFLLFIVNGVKTIAGLALWNWKKWGFWAYVAADILLLVAYVIYVQGLVFGNLAVSIIGTLILYSALKAGENKAWSRLK